MTGGIKQLVITSLTSYFTVPWCMYIILKVFSNYMGFACDSAICISYADTFFCSSLSLSNSLSLKYTFII